MAAFQVITGFSYALHALIETIPLYNLVLLYASRWSQKKAIANTKLEYQISEEPESRRYPEGVLLMYHSLYAP